VNRVRRTIIGASLAVLLVTITLGVGNALGGDGSASGSAHAKTTLTAKLTPAQLLATANTATGIHLRYAGITTGPLVPTHDNDIQIQSFSFGVSRNISPGSSATRTAGTANVGDISLSHQTDSFSLALLRVALKGMAPGVPASLYFTDTSGTGGTDLDYLEIDLGQTLISSFQMSSGGQDPNESLTLNFVTMTFKYQVAGSPIQTVSYNLATGS
jgi:type VI secretion system secreted protein Hcp